MKACGTGAQGLDTLSALGVSISQNWVYKGIRNIAGASRVSLLRDIKKYPWTLSYDNINVRMKKFQQRLENRTSFDSGTVGVVYVHTSPEASRPDAAAYRQQLAEGSNNPIDAVDIHLLDSDAGPRLREFGIHFLVLTNSAEGDGFMSSEFQHTLRGRSMADTFADVAVGSEITIRHLNTQGGYLHSHPHTYPGGSKRSSSMRSIKILITDFYYHRAADHIVPPP